MFLDTARPPSGTAIYAIGDIHGRLDLLTLLLDSIDADIAGQGARRSVIVTLGDYVDRGPDTAGVLDLLARRASDPDFICLRGNHDQWVLDFLEDPFEHGAHWLRWGGRETLASYAVTADWEEAPHELAREFNRTFPRRHLQFLRESRFSHCEGDFFFAHAGVRPGVALEEQRPDDLMWIREPFLLSQEDFGKVVIHGHTPQDEVDIRPNRINADTRAFDSGMLSCVVLEERGTRILSACIDAPAETIS